jgi:hypothetical protein
MTSNQRLRRSTLRVRYIKNVTTPHDLQRALAASGIPSEVSGESVTVWTVR